MAYQNISASISKLDIDEIKKAIESIKTKLPFLINLTPQERQMLPKMADKTLPFVKKSIEYAENNKKLVPSYLNITELKTDLQLAQDLDNLLKLVKPLTEMLEDSAMASGSEAYTAALGFYNTVKVASKMNVPGTDAIHADLKERFNIAAGRSEEQLKEVNPN